MNLSLKEKIALSFVTINHVIGFLGLNFTDYSELFVMLTPVNLLITFLVLFVGERKWKPALLVLFIVAFTAGMVVEIVGVKTGVVFGGYNYTPILGPSFLGVPLIIGLNWFLLLYCIGNFIEHFFNFGKNIWCLLGASLMVAIDFLIEPFAVQFNLWEWHTQSGMPDFKNYLAWFVVSLILYIAFKIIIPKPKNVLAAYIFIILIFFFTLNFITFKLL